MFKAFIKQYIIYVSFSSVNWYLEGENQNLKENNVFPLHLILEINLEKEFAIQNKIGFQGV